MVSVSLARSRMRPLYSPAEGPKPPVFKDNKIPASLVTSAGAYADYVCKAQCAGVDEK